MSGFTHIAFHPLVPWWTIGLLGALALLLVGIAFWRRSAGRGWRFAVLALLLGALANPAVIEEERKAERDTALIVADESGSLAIGDRAQARDAAVTALRERLGALPNLDVRVVTAGETTGARGRDEDGGTKLFDAVRRGFADIPRQRQAGAIIVTDGQVHDVPAAPAAANLPPLHGLLVGRPDEADRRITLLQAPTFGIVGHDVDITFRVDDLGPANAQGTNGRPVRVTIRRNGQADRVVGAVPGEDTTVAVRIDRGGRTFVELDAEPGQRELTLANNRAVAALNGVRDRLKVLLVSGRPHTGERIWRNLLKSDPSVDLVHFTILRPPEKQDATPIRELSLIAFPIRELFETKLSEFDLVIFDSYERRGIIPQNYLGNVARYVRNGGALLEAVGPGFARPFTSLFRTPLGDVYPVDPTGKVMLEGFRPSVSEAGRRHPVTADLAPRAARTDGWGRWLRQVDADVRSGTALMNGAEDRPLLVLDRVGEGRVGLLLSDQIWLWARGYEGGGPHGELLRRLAHWLMKEPELEENATTADVSGDQLTVERRSLAADETPVTVTAPDGSTSTLALRDAGGGRAIGSMPVGDPGLYRIQDGDRLAIAAAGPPNPREMSDVRATRDLLAPAAQAVGGSVNWLSQGGVPEVRMVGAGRSLAGRNWIGLRANGDYTISGIRQIPLLPPWLAFVLIASVLAMAWWREAR